MDSNDGSPAIKKHKKHKKDRGDKYEGYGHGSGSSTPAIKLILKVGGGGSSTPEHSDSPGPNMLSVMNPHLSNFDEDSQHSSVISISSHPSKKSKKKDKKKHKNKKHKHHHKEKKRSKEERKEELILDESMEIEPEALPATPIGISSHIPQLTQPIASSQKPLQSQEEDAPKEPKPHKLQKFLDKQPFQKLLDYLLRTLEKKDAQQFFAWPVTDKIAPGYSSIIKKPMDFRTMKSKIETYSTLAEFSDDFKLMCNNAMIYNQPDTIYFKAAKKLLQSGLKILSPEKIKSLMPLIPSIRLLTEEHLGSPLFPTDSAEATEISQSEDENNILDLICLDPTQSIHYVQPHPNDPPDLCGAFTDDLTTEEVLLQARLAAREAAHRLATKKPNSKMGFLRQREDGSTSLSILTPTNAVLPGTKELPVSLGALSGKLTHGTTQVHSFKEDKRNLQRPVKVVSYGAFSSFAPSQDSTFSNLTPEETEILSNTYGDNETAVQYAESMIEFAKGCDYAMHMVDEILDTITKGEHRKTVNFIEERKKVEEEEIRVKRQQEELTNELEMEWQHHFGPVEQLHSLKQEFGIDTQFLEEFQGSASEKLAETAGLIGDLEKAQNERLTQGTYPFPPYVPPISDLESQLASKITTNLTEMAKQATPGELINPEAIRNVMGIDIENASFQPKIEPADD